MHLLSPEGLRFTESPRSPLRRSKSRRNTSPLHKSDTNARKIELVGSLSAVNEHLSREGLLRPPPIQPLISELSFRPTTPEVVRKLRKGSEKQENANNKNNNNEDTTALVERFLFPGYSSDTVTPLPHNVDALKHMEMITRAQKTFKTKHTFLQYWKEIFYSAPSHDMFVDIFWWFFLHRYQPERHTQDQLFARVASNYIKLLNNVSQEKSDAIFKVYPDILAQCVYSAFTHAFPTSWNSFDEEFKTSLCSVVYQWIIGLKPLPNIWKYWNIIELEPKNIMRHVSAKNDKKTVSSHKKFDLDCLIADMLKHEEGEASSNDEHLPRIVGKRLSVKPVGSCRNQSVLPLKEMETMSIKGPQFEHAVVDITRHSPLVQYFLSQHNLHYQNNNSLLIKHNNISEQLAGGQQDNPTYQEVIKHSLDKSQATKDTFDRNYKEIKEHMYKHERERTLVRRREARDLHGLMRCTREVKTLSTFLTANQLCEQPEKRRKSKATKIITDATKRT